MKFVALGSFEVRTYVRIQVRTQVEGNYENLTLPLLCRKAKEKKRDGKGCLMKLLRGLKG